MSPNIISQIAFYFFYSILYTIFLHSFPTRRSSDLAGNISGNPSLALVPRYFCSPPPPALWILNCLSRSRSEEHTSELQSRENLVCRLLLEKKLLSVHTSAVIRQLNKTKSASSDSTS